MTGRQLIENFSVIHKCVVLTQSNFFLNPRFILSSLVTAVSWTESQWIWSESWKHWAQDRRIHPGWAASPSQGTLHTHHAHTQSLLGVIQHCQSIYLHALGLTGEPRGNTNEHNMGNSRQIITLGSGQGPWSCQIATLLTVQTVQLCSPNNYQDQKKKIKIEHSQSTHIGNKRVFLSSFFHIKTKT